MTGRRRFAALWLAGRRRIRRQNGAGFLGIPFPLQSLCHGMQRSFQLGARARRSMILSY
jgi:hypothetical protein